MSQLTEALLEGIDEVAPEARGGLDSMLTLGESLAEGRWRNWVESLNDPYTQALTSILLENQLDYIRSIPRGQQMIFETTFMGDPGIAVNPDVALPLIRAIIPNLVATELVSVQPMTSPAGLIFYLQFLYGTDKGGTQRGRQIFDFPDKNYSSGNITSEPFALGTGATGPYAGVLAFTPIKPGTVSLTDGTQVIRDNGAGAIGGGTVNYTTGVVAGATFGGAVTSGAQIYAAYQWNSEGSDKVPQIDIHLTSTPITAQTRKLRARISSEANINLKRVHGLDAVGELNAIMGEEVKFEIRINPRSPSYSNVG